MTEPAAILGPDGVTTGLTSAVQALPIAAHLLAGGVLGAGLILWCMGRRVVKPGFALVGGLVGGGAGFLLGPALGPAEIGGFPTPYVGLGVGAALGLIAGVMLFRFAVAISTGAVLGLAGVLVSLIVMTSPETQAEAGDAIGAAALQTFQGAEDGSAGETSGGGGDPAALAPPPPAEFTPSVDSALSEETKQKMRAVAERVEAFLVALGDELRPRWEALPGRARLTILAAGLGGSVAGFLLGLVMPQRSSAAMTALFGAAVWLPAAVWLAHAFDAPGRQLLNLSALGWTVAWVIMAAIGFAAQVSGMRRPKKSEEE